jgi:hypothetical protein
MAVRWLTSSGNFSSTSVWNDGTLLGIPTTGDDVFTNSFTVTMDVNATVNSLNNSALAAQSTRLNPVMTSNTTPSGVVTISSSGAGTTFGAFNGSTDTGANVWTSGGAAPQWVQYQFTSSLIIRSYSIFYNASVSGRPVNFNLQGSNDGVAFTTLDTRTGFVFTNNQYGTFTITPPYSAYSYYRLNVTATDIGNPQVVELTFNEAGITTTAGGSFNFNTAGVTVTCTSTSASLSAGATNLITVTATTGTVTLNLGSSVINGTGGTQIINYTGNCNFNLSGISFNVGGGNNALFVNKTSTGTITMTGDLTSNGANAGSIVLNSTAGNSVVNGNIRASLSGGISNNGISQTSGNLTINGVVTGGNGATGVAFSGAGTLTINGNVLSGLTSAGVSTSAPTNTITGNIIAGTVAAISSTTANTINVIGDVYASATANGISSTNASGVVNLTGNMYNGLGRNAIYCQNVFISNTATTLWRMDTGGGNYKFLYSADTTPNLPPITDVRFGTTFGPALSLTGTMVVLANSDVRKDVPNDNSVGTAELTSADIISGINASSDPLAVRLKNALTDVTAGNIISQYKDS